MMTEDGKGARRKVASRRDFLRAAAAAGAGVGAVRAGTLDTNGGPVINAKGQVIDTRGRPIPGLYGAGNCIASPAGQAYWGAGGTLGPALTFGTLCGQYVSAEPAKADN